MQTEPDHNREKVHHKDIHLKHIYIYSNNFMKNIF